jgi:hypothetical protein
VELLASIENKVDWVHLEVKLINWEFANFDVCLRQGTPISTIMRKIAEKHGRIDDLKLYRSPPDEKSVFTDEDLTLTLADHGFLGGPKEDDEEKYTVFYDFRPALSDPLLLKEPQLILPDDPMGMSNASIGDTVTEGDSKDEEAES